MLLLTCSSNAFFRTRYILLHTSLQLWCLILQKMHWPLFKRLMNIRKHITFYLQSHHPSIFINLDHINSHSPDSSTPNASIALRHTAINTTGSLPISNWHPETFDQSPSCSFSKSLRRLFPTCEYARCTSNEQGTEVLHSHCQSAKQLLAPSLHL